MPPLRTKEMISSIMSKIRSRGTTPERTLVSALKKMGFRVSFRTKRLPGKPDLLIPEHRLAIFVDGDFWHGNQWTRRKLRSLESQFISKRQRAYWPQKITRNMQRDCIVTAQLIQQKFRVLRLWTHDIEKNLDACLNSVTHAIESTDRSMDVLASKTFAEFFAGIGLVRAALQRQGWSAAFANDFDLQKAEMYRTHFNTAMSTEDVHKIDPRRLPNVTLATASFPCNDLSLAGARNGLKGKHSSAFWGFFDALAGMKSRKPPIVMLENVPGLITSHNGKDLEEILTALNGLGYVTDMFVLDAAHFVPQSRQRLFVLGILSTIPHSVPSLPLNLAAESILRPKLVCSFIKSHNNILWYLRNLPEPPTLQKKLADVLDDLPSTDAHWWSTERKEYLYLQFSRKHRELADDMIAAKKWSYGTVFRRIRNGRSMAELRTDGIAGCLRTPRGGSARQILFKAGYGRYEVRLLTARECARLMGADDYKLDAKLPLNQALFGFGDAVCVPAVEWIAQNYLNPIVNELLRSQPQIA